MKAKFKIGDRVRCIHAHPKYEYIRGAVGTVVGDLLRDPDIRRGFSHEIKFDLFPAPDGYDYWTCCPIALEPLYDGDQKSSWSECAWKPKGVAA